MLPHPFPNGEHSAVIATFYPNPPPLSCQCSPAVTSTTLNVCAPLDGKCSNLDCFREGAFPNSADDPRYFFI